MAEERLKALDADHFWFDEVLIDLVQLRHQRDSLNLNQQGAAWQAGGRDIHERNSAIYMLDFYAGQLAKGKQELATPENVEKYVRMAAQYGLFTGWKES